MKTFFTICLFWFVSMSAYSQAVTQTIHQAITCSDIQTVVLQLDGEVEMKETKGTRILMETTVTVNAPNTALLEYLISSGRYNIAQQTNAADASLTLTSNKRANVIMVKGAECKEEIKHVIYLPAHIKFTQNNSSATASSK